MSGRLQARAHPAGGRIDLRWTYDQPLGAAGPPRLRLLRKRLGPPATLKDGAVVVDLGELFAKPGQPWVRLERLSFRTMNSASPEGLLEAEVALFHDAPPPSEPILLRLRLFDPATQAMVEESVTDCSRVVRAVAAAPPWRERETLTAFRKPGGGPEVPGGQIEILTGNAVPGVSDGLVWSPAAGPARTAQFDAVSRLKLDRIEGDLGFESRTLDGGPGARWLMGGLSRKPEAGVQTWSFRLPDGGLEPRVDYYYSLFDLGQTPPLLDQAVALATADYDSPRRLFQRLPGAYQRLDEPDPPAPTGEAGPLRHFLTPIGHALDAARSTAEGLRDRHDAFKARSSLLPSLARMIGWAPDLAAPVDAQRRDLLFAPEIFDTVGTGPNVRALVNRIASWPCRVKEFVDNVFLTNAPEGARLWELWQIEHDGTGWGKPSPITLTTDADARPAPVVDGSGVVWLFWHSDRGGRREIWRQRLGGVDAAPSPARAGAPDDIAGPDPRETDAAAVWDGSKVRLFWSAVQEGRSNLWTRSFSGSPPGGAPERITDHDADDRSPAAVVVPGAPARLWLFWSSSRRGPTDIWARVLDLGSGSWTEAERLTDAPLRDERPAATEDGSGRIWLFWTRDAGGRQVIWHKVRDAGVWGADEPLDVGHRRDEAPAAVPWKGGIVLLWQSDHGGSWQTWGRFRDATGWHEPARLDPNPLGNKEPAAVIDTAGHMRVVWRSQRRALWYRSRTVDLGDPIALAEMGTVEDHSHYTFDTGRLDQDLYSRETVGVYLQPTTVVAQEIEAGRSRARSFVEPFRPLPARYLWLLDPGPHPSPPSTQGVAAEEWLDDIV